MGNIQTRPQRQETRWASQLFGLNDDISIIATGLMVKFTF